MQVMMMLRLPLSPAPAATAALRPPQRLLGHQMMELRTPQYVNTQPTSLVRVSIKCFITADIYAAIRSKNINKVQKILTKNPNLINSTDQVGSYPIHEACKVGDLQVVKFLYERYPQAVTETDRHGRNPLHYAANAGRLAVVEYLLSLPLVANIINVRDENNHTPLKLANRGRQTAIVALLKQWGAHD